MKRALAAIPSPSAIGIPSVHREHRVQSVHREQSVQSVHREQSVQSVHREQSVQSSKRLMNEITPSPFATAPICLASTAARSTILECCLTSSTWSSPS